MVKKKILEDEIASLKTEIASLNVTRQQQQKEIYDTNEKLMAEHTSAKIENSEAREAIRKVQERGKQLKSALVKAIQGYNNIIDIIAKVKK